MHNKILHAREKIPTSKGAVKYEMFYATNYIIEPRNFQGF